MAKSRLTRTFAGIIRAYRIQRGMTQEALAEAAGIHHTYVGLLERGQRIPTIDVAERLATPKTRPRLAKRDWFGQARSARCRYPHALERAIQRAGKISRHKDSLAEQGGFETSVSREAFAKENLREY
jgi:transcriptional regulator with XRE-family HTH domain